MRKDVRLGLGVGGILFGVVLIYVLFFAGGGGNKSEDQIAGDFDSSSSEVTNSGTAAGGSSSAETLVAPSNANAGGVTTLVQPGTTTGTRTGTVPAPQGTHASQPQVTIGGPATRPVGTVAHGTFAQPTAWDWRELMNNGDRNGQLLSHTTTPTPGGGRENLSFPMPQQPSREILLDGPAGVGTSATESRTYTVKSGDSFWSIARSEYGNASYYAHLVRANPRVDPSKLKAGMKITIPARNEVIPRTAPPSAVTPTPVVIDETRQYRVVRGDSLAGIARKLYGREAMADRIYELNRDVIGPNPSALKLNAILTLPEAPARVATN